MARSALKPAAPCQQGGSKETAWRTMRLLVPSRAVMSVTGKGPCRADHAVHEHWPAFDDGVEAHYEELTGSR